MRYLLIPALPLLPTALLCSSCDEASSSPSSNDPQASILSQGWRSFESGEYRLEGGQLVLDRGSAVADTARWCVMGSGLGALDSLVENPNAMPRFDTLFPQVRGDTLEIHFAEDDVDREYNTAAILLRKSGAGLDGNWRVLEYRQKVGGKWYPRFRSAAEKAQDIRLVLEGGRYFWAEKMLITWADLQIFQWNGNNWDETLLPDSARYDIEVSKIDEESVRYRGRKTGEVVDVRRVRISERHQMQGDVRYSSSDPSHPAFVRKERLESCPEMLPWYHAFRDSNARPLAGRTPVAVPAVASSGPGALPQGF